MKNNNMLEEILYLNNKREDYIKMETAKERNIFGFILIILFLSLISLYFFYKLNETFVFLIFTLGIPTFLLFSFAYLLTFSISGKLSYCSKSFQELKQYKDFNILEYIKKLESINLIQIQLYIIENDLLKESLYSKINLAIEEELNARVLKEKSKIDSLQALKDKIEILNHKNDLIENQYINTIDEKINLIKNNIKNNNSILNS